MKKTKIVATISDLNCDVEFLKKLYKSGVNAMRLNTAHQTLEDSKKVIANIRKVSSKIAIMIDTKGPEVRIMNLDENILVKSGDTILFSDKTGREADVLVNYDGFVEDVCVGVSFFLDDA